MKIENLEDVNSYLKDIGLGFLQFYSMGELLSAYISCRNANKLLLEQSNKTIQSIRDEIEKDWIKEILDNSSNLNLDSQLQNKLLEVQSDLSQFDEFFIQFMESFQDQGLDVNSIDNLVLLDSSTNRSYKNSVFPIKRRKIIEREKTGTFVPICTKNVFMKFYSTDVEQMSFWGEKDREQYLNDIEETINSLKKS